MGKKIPPNLPKLPKWRKRGFRMSILKEMIKAATGIEIEVHNVIVDFRTPDGKSAHRAHQVVSSGAPCTDEAITERIKADLPQGCRLCSLSRQSEN